MKVAFGNSLLLVHEKGGEIESQTVGLHHLLIPSLSDTLLLALTICTHTSLPLQKSSLLHGTILLFRIRLLTSPDSPPTFQIKE